MKQNLRAFLSLPLLLGDPANAFNTHPGRRRARMPVLSTTTSIKLSEENTAETATVQKLEPGDGEDDASPQSPPAPIFPEGQGDDSEERSGDFADGISDDGEPKSFDVVEEDEVGKNKPDDETSATAALLPRPPSSLPPQLSTVSTPPPVKLRFDTSNPTVITDITKLFVESDFGISLDSLDYGERLLSDSFVWISGNNLADGRTGILNRAEYLAAGRFFDIRRSFPDLDYRAYDFRIVNEGSTDGIEDGETSTKEGVDKDLTPLEKLQAKQREDKTPLEKLNAGEVTVRFTTRTVGSFKGLPLRLRSKVLEPNGRLMKCPPSSVSVTYCTTGPDTGKITKLVTDMVMDREFGNTRGFSGLPAAAIVAGDESSFDSTPPLVALERLLFQKKPKQIMEDESVLDSYAPPFPKSVLLQLAEGVVDSNFGLDDNNLLSRDFTYIEPLLGPLSKEQYISQFEEYNVLGGMPDLDYGLEGFRIDEYDPYRVWVDSRATGTRIGSIGNRPLPPNVESAKYTSPPEAISLTFDDDGFLTRLTAGAVHDPTLGNTGGLGGVYGMLYATGTPENDLKTRSVLGILNRAQKSLFDSNADDWKLSDGRLVKSALPATRANLISLLPSIGSVATTKMKTAELPTAFGDDAGTTGEDDELSTDGVLDAVPISSDPADPVTEAFTGAFGITEPGLSRTDQLRDAAEAARAIAAEQRAKSKEFQIQAEAEKKAALELSIQREREATARRRKQAEETRQQREEAKLKGGNTQSEWQQYLKGQMPKLPTKATPPREKKPKPVKKSRPVATTKKTKPVSPRKVTSTSAKSRSPSILLPKQQPSKKSRSTKKSRPTTPPKRSPTLSLFASSPKSIAKDVKRAAERKRSPTLSLFATQTKSVSSGVRDVKKSAKRSPTLNILDALKSASNPRSKGAASATRSPTISLKDRPKRKKITSRNTRKASTANAIAGVGTTTKRTVLSSKAKAAVTKNPTYYLLGAEAQDAEDRAAANQPRKKVPKKTKSPEKKRSVSPARSSPTFSLFGGGESRPTTKATQLSSKQPEMVSSPKPKKATVSRPTFNLFDIGSTANKAVEKAKAEPEKTKKIPASTVKKKKPSPRQSKGKTASKLNRSTQPPKPRKTVSRPTFSLFDLGGTGNKTVEKTSAGPQKAKKTPASTVKKKKPSPRQSKGKTATTTKRLKQSVKVSPPKRDMAPKANNLFGGFFTTQVNEPKRPAKTANKNVPKKKDVTLPILKQWKQKDGGIEGRIFGSSSFKDGTKITTSKIRKGKIESGTTVQTVSGSRYILE